MRIDPVHHKLAFFQSDAGPGFCHINFQVETLDDVMRNWRFLQQNDVQILHGPGRHPTSTAIFVYFLGPDNLTYEYSFGVQLIEDEAWTPHVRARRAGLDRYVVGSNPADRLPESTRRPLDSIAFCRCA